MNDREGIDVEVKVLPEGAIVAPLGEIDLGRAPAFREHLSRVQRERHRRVIVDLSQVPYMDSSGVATLVEAMQTARRFGSKLVLCCLQERVRSIFEIARLETIFTIVPNTEDGMRV